MKNNEMMKIMKYLILLELENENKIDEQMIQKSFRELSFIYHPDMAEERYKDGKRFVELQQAREYLISNISYVNNILSGGASNTPYSSYSYSEERRRKEEEARKKAEERRYKEEETRKKTEERRRRSASKEDLKKEKYKNEKIEIGKRLKKEILENIDKDLYRQKEYKYILSFINEYINEYISGYSGSIHYQAEYEILMAEVKKVKTKKYFKKLKIFRNVSLIGLTCISVSMLIAFLISFIIGPTVKHLIGLLIH